MFAKMPLQKLENDRARDPMARSRREELGRNGPLSRAWGREDREQGIPATDLHKFEQILKGLWPTYKAVMRLQPFWRPTLEDTRP